LGISSFDYIYFHYTTIAIKILMVKIRLQIVILLKNLLSLSKQTIVENEESKIKME